MNMTDPIADMLTRIRNAGQVRHPTVDMPSSRVKVALARVLKDEGYIAAYQVLPQRPGVTTLRITLRYDARKRPLIEAIQRVSVPGRRLYRRHDAIPRVRHGLGVAILSTSQGILTDREARSRGIGGEVLCRVW